MKYSLKTLAIFMLLFLRIAILISQPVTSIISPSAGSWHKGNFTVSFTDTPSGSEIILTEWRITSSGIVTLDYTSRPVGGDVTVTVGSSAYARHQGSNIVKVEGKSTDALNRTSTIASRMFSIDWSSDQIASLTVKTSITGTLITAGAWTSDRDPYFSFSINTGQRIAPITGYSFAFGQNPDDIPEVAGGDNGAIQINKDQLSEGPQTFKLKAIDAAGNQGIIYTYNFGVDYTSDNISSITAKTEQGGIEIPPSTDQTDNLVWFEWPTPSSSSPIVGYSWALNNNPDGVIETTSNGVIVSLPLGISTFKVRSVDAAGNVGPVSSFEIWVSTPTEILDLEHLKFNVYPNPTSGNVVVQIENFNLNDEFYYTLHDLTGTMIAAERIIEELSVVRIPRLTSGVYIFRLFVNDILFESRKIIKI